jgi:proteasome activator subunit 3 (PA28 gamma)
VPRALQELIISTSAPSSPFHSSNLSTDATVYPSPTLSLDEPESKKRKLDESAPNGSSHADEGARFANQMLANSHIQNVHDILKKECEELAEYIVSL